MRESIVVFTIDDGYIQDYTTTYNEFRKRGLYATSYLNGGLMGAGRNDTVRMSWVHARGLKSKGWDLQCHNFNHTSFENLTDLEVEQSLINNANVMAEQGIGIPEHHALAYGSCTPNQLNLVLEHRKTARKIELREDNIVKYIDYTYEEIYHEKSWHANPMDVQSDTHYQKIIQAIDNVEGTGKVCIFYFHFVMPEGEIDPNRYWFINLNYLKSILDYVLTKKIRVMTISEMWNHVEQELTQ